LENFQVVCSFGSFPSVSSLRRPVVSDVARVAPDRDWRLPQTLSSPLLDLLAGFSLSFWSLFSESFGVARQRGQSRWMDPAHGVPPLVFASVPNLLGMHASSAILFSYPLARAPTPQPSRQCNLISVVHAYFSNIESFLSLSSRPPTLPLDWTISPKVLSCILP